MRILVTGGAGFIGKHLCRRLVSEGHEVTVFDTKSAVMYAMECGADFMPSHFVQGKVQTACKWTEARRWPKSGPFNSIYNLACHASPSRYQEDPLFTIDTCIRGTRECLSHAMPECRVLLASTSEIYGEPEVHPQPESYRGNVNCLGPRACYDEGKRMAECLMMDYHRQHGVDTRIARIFNTYGPGMDFDDGRVISNFVTQALKGEPLTIYGDGSQTRSFCYVDDMVEGLIRLMEYEGPECHEPHNLGNPEEQSVLNISWATFNAVHAKQLDDCYTADFKPLPQDDPTRRCPDITRAKKNLGWEPRAGLSEGLKRTVEDFRSRMKLEAAQ